MRGGRGAMLPLVSSFLGRAFAARLAPAAPAPHTGPRQVTTCMAKKKGEGPSAGCGGCKCVRLLSGDR